MKIGDLVEILESTMGTKFSTNISGIIVKKSECYSEFWDVLVCGKIKSINKNYLQKL